MSDEKYGPQTAEIQNLIGRLKTITPDQAMTLAGEHDPARIESALAVALKAASEADRERMWCQAIDEAAIISRCAGAVGVWDTAEEAVDDAILALLVRDLIDTEQFNTLYWAWESMVDRQNNEQTQSETTDGEIIASLRREVAHCEDEIRELVAALAVRDEQLATSRDDFRSSERESRRWRKRARKLKAKLAKFQPCDDSNGCYDDCGRVHIYDAAEPSFSYANNNERPRAVYHKEDE